MLSRPNISQAKCVLVVGATSGIGRALALAIHDLPSKPTVIIAGRRQGRIDELTKRSDRFKGIKIDLLGGRAALKAWADEVVAAYPDVSVASTHSMFPCTDACSTVGRDYPVFRHSASLRLQTSRERGP